MGDSETTWVVLVASDVLVEVKRLIDELSLLLAAVLEEPDVEDPGELVDAGVGVTVTVNVALSSILTRETVVGTVSVIVSSSVLVTYCVGGSCVTVTVTGRPSSPPPDGLDELPALPVDELLPLIPSLPGEPSFGLPWPGSSGTMEYLATLTSLLRSRDRAISRRGRERTSGKCDAARTIRMLRKRILSWQARPQCDQCR